MLAVLPAAEAEAPCRAHSPLSAAEFPSFDHLAAKPSCHPAPVAGPRGTALKCAAGASKAPTAPKPPKQQLRDSDLMAASVREAPQVGVAPNGDGLVITWDPAIAEYSADGGVSGGAVVVEDGEDGRIAGWELHLLRATTTTAAATAAAAVAATKRRSSEGAILGEGSLFARLSRSLASKVAHARMAGATRRSSLGGIDAAAHGADKEEQWARALSVRVAPGDRSLLVPAGSMPWGWPAMVKVRVRPLLALGSPSAYTVKGRLSPPSSAVPVPRGPASASAQPSPAHGSPPGSPRGPPRGGPASRNPPPRMSPGALPRSSQPSRRQRQQQQQHRPRHNSYYASCVVDELAADTLAMHAYQRDVLGAQHIRNVAVEFKRRQLEAQRARERRAEEQEQGQGRGREWRGGGGGVAGSGEAAAAAAAGGCARRRAWVEPSFVHFVFWAFPENTSVVLRDEVGFGFERISGSEATARGLRFDDVAPGDVALGAAAEANLPEAWVELYASASAADLLLTWVPDEVPGTVMEFATRKACGGLPLPRAGGALMRVAAGGGEIEYGGKTEIIRAMGYRALLRIDEPPSC